MKIMELIAGRLSLSDHEEMIKKIGKSKSLFHELMNCLFSGNLRASQNAAWIASEIVRAHPSLVQSYSEQVASLACTNDVDEAVLRNVLRLLMAVTIPEVCHGALMNRCFELIESPARPPAIKANALSVLANFCTQYPEIMQELKIIIMGQFQHESPAFRSRAKKILHQ
jgi:hypothetical protein